MLLSQRPGARLLAAATAFPEHVLDRERALAMLTRLFPGESREFVAGLIERSGVAERRLAVAPEELGRPSDFTARNRRFALLSTDLAARAARSALERSGIDAREIDVVIDVSCTGVTIPALDVALCGALGLRDDVRRVPVTESGCAAGGLALGLAASLAQHGERVLVVAVELCSLTLGPGERARSDLVAAVIFGDGAAAAIVAPAEIGPRVVAVGSALVPESQSAMGFDVGAHGLRLFLRRELPSILIQHLPRALDRFLAAHSRTRTDIGLHLVHPGGRKILDSYRSLFELAPDDLRFSFAALASQGNLSSASILGVLELALAEPLQLGDGREALMVAIGPGLSLEFLLVDWNGAPRA